MAGYSDTRQLIIDTLMGRPSGTEIQPEDHQAFALALNDYIRSVELVAGSGVPVAFAEPNTVPVQPNNGQAVYLSSVGGDNSKTFTNFIGQDGNAISVSSSENVFKMIVLLWNGSYWSSQVTGVNAIRDTTNGYLFMGAALPSTNPLTPTQKVFYIASQIGTYSHFDNIVVDNDYTILYYDGRWKKVTYIRGLEQIYSDFIVSAELIDWQGIPSDIDLKVNFIFRNNETLGSGVRIGSYRGTQELNNTEAYWRGDNITNGGVGIATLKELSLASGYGKIRLTVNWDVLPDGAYQTYGYEKWRLVNPISLRNKYVKYTDLEGIQTDLVLTGSDFTFRGYVVTPAGNFYPLSDNEFWSTDYIPITSPNGIKIRVKALELNNDYVYGVAFYSSNKSFISGLSDIEGYDKGKDYDIDEIPQEAKYVRFSLFDTLTTTRVEFILKNVASSILQGIDAPEALSKATQALEISQENSSKLITETTRVAGLDDAEFFSGQYGQYGVGEYTRPQAEVYAFNEVLVRGIHMEGNECEYRIYSYSGVSDPTLGYAPVGIISPSTHTLIAQGTINKRGVDYYEDYTIHLDTFAICPQNNQIIIYLMSDQRIYIKGSTPENLIEGQDSNSVLFSLVQGNEVWDNNWYQGYAGYRAMSLWLYSTPIFLTKENVENQIIEIATPIVENKTNEIVDSHIKYGLKIQLPEIIYAVEGTEINLWHDTLCLSVDRGLASPLNYSVQWYCQVGLVTERCFRFTPTASNVNKDYKLTCYIYNIFGQSLTNKEVTIRVLPKNKLNVSKNIIYFGDSLGSAAAQRLYGDFNNQEKFTGVKPKMLGTNSASGVDFQAVGGDTWSNYATRGEIAWRVYVSGITSLAINSVYTDATGKGFVIKEVNITNGAGNVLFMKSYNPSAYGYGDLQIPTGTMTKYSGAGDDSFTYSGGFVESANPLWNNETEMLDLGQYKQRLVDLGQLSSLQDKIDAVSFQFGINDRGLADNLPLLLSYIEDLYNLFISDNPNCKFLIGLTTTSGNTLNGAGANYGASWNNATYAKQVFTIRDFYLSLQNSVTFPNIRICAINPQVDRYYGYDFSSRAISQRDPEEEKYHNNCVHPGAIGYGQIADAYFASFVGCLTE